AAAAFLGAEQPSGSTAESARVDASSSATTRQHDNHSDAVIGSDPNTTAVSATAALLNAAHLYPAYTPATPIGHDPNTTMAQHYYAQNPVSFANVGMPFVPVYGLNMFPAPNAATFLPACGGAPPLSVYDLDASALQNQIAAYFNQATPQ
ncbi:hypothetical protein PENTCL1PPCAC_24207, partial [Pristionchus entomophagus]